MNIKLRAKIKAYGKLDLSQTNLPQTSKEDAGKFLGVDTSGKITLFDNASETFIDNMFNSDTVDNTDSNKQSLIDSLFN